MTPRHELEGSGFLGENNHDATLWLNKVEDEAVYNKCILRSALYWNKNKLHVYVSKTEVYISSPRENKQPSGRSSEFKRNSNPTVNADYDKTQRTQQV